MISGSERENIWHDDRACDGNGIYPLFDKEGDKLTITKYLYPDDLSNQIFKVDYWRKLLKYFHLK